MVLKLFVAIILCGTLVCGAATTRAQIEVRGAAMEKDDTAIGQPLQQAAYRSLEDVLADIDALRLAENRVMLRATAAGLLWARDEERARSLFRQSVADLGAISFEERAPTYQRQNEMQAAHNLRQQILQLVAQRDARLALELLRSSRQDLTWVGQSLSTANSYDAQMEMNLAQQVASTDPQLALKLAEERLKKGLSQEVVSVLTQLRDKDPKAATSLTEKIMERLRHTDLNAEQQAFYGAYNLLQNVTQQREESGRTPLLNEGATGELVEFITAGLLNRPVPPYELQQYMPTLIPLLRKYAPSRVAALERRAAEAQRYLDPSTQLYNDFNSRLQNASLDDVLAWTAKAPVEMRDNFYQQAAWKALDGNDATRARQIANDHIADPVQRQSLLAQIEQRFYQRAVSENRLSEARALIGGISVPEEHLNALLQLALNLKNKGDATTARSVLAEAESFIEQNFDSAGRLRAQLQLAQACPGVDAKRGLEVVANATTLLNDLLEHAVALDEYLPHQRSFKEGEMLMQQYGSGLSELLRNRALALQVLARDDFARANTIADEARRPEVRLMARLMVVQGALAENNASRIMMKRNGVVRSGR